MTLILKSKSSSPIPTILNDNEPQKPLEQQLSESILLAEQIRKSTSSTCSSDYLSFKFECYELSKHVDYLSHILRSLVRFTTTHSSSSIYERPIRHISSEVSRTLLRAHSLIRKCRRRTNILLRLVSLVTAADFRKLFSLLEASIANLRWLISVFHVDDASSNDHDMVLSLPPIASNDPILAWVWSYIANVQMGFSLSGRIEAAYEIGVLAQDNDRNKKMIVEEGGVPPLLRLLKEGISAEGQIAAANALYNVCNNRDSVSVIVENLGIPLIVQLLANSTMRVQIRACELVAKMAEIDDDDDDDDDNGCGLVKEEFGKENAICPLVSLLSFETFENAEFQVIKRKTMKERENESSEIKHELKISSAKALWMLAKNSISNSSRITETKGLLCLAKLIEKHKGILQKYCVLASMEVTSAAELNSELRMSAFKTNSPAAKAMVSQLILVMTNSDDQILQLSAVRSIGCLSRTFYARETRVIATLVELLSSIDHEVATEAAIALAKFAEPENFLCQQHCKTIIEFNGVIPLMRLLRVSEEALVHGLVLLCYLAISASNNEVLEQARVMAVLEGADRSLIAQHPQLGELVAKGMYHLGLYRGDIHPFRQSSIRI